MKNRILSLVLVLMIACMGLTAHAQSQYVPNEVLVQLQPGVDINAFNTYYNTTTLSAASTNTPTGSNSYCLGTATGVNDSTLATTMSADPNVVSAEPNQEPVSQFIFTANGEDQSSQFIFTADADDQMSTQFVFTANQFVFTANQFEFMPNQFIFTQSADPGLYSYMTQPATSLIHDGATAKKYNGSGVIVAVLDTGVSLRNALLAPHVTNGWNFINNTSNTDDCPTGLDSNGNGIPDEDAGHGTMVAGLINRYAQGATILPVKVLDSDGSGSLWATVQGIRYAISRGANVINMSFGSLENSPMLQAAIKEAWNAGVIIVTAGGNNNTSTMQYPAGDNMTLAVASTDNYDVKASFSNYGTWIDLVAPGVNITSTFWNGGYASWSGTSFSSPMVAAEAALIMSAKPNWTPAHVRNRIKNTADSVLLQNIPYFGLLGSGIIDLDAALSGL